jgi:hypothetical protein
MVGKGAWSARGHGTIHRFGRQGGRRDLLLPRVKLVRGGIHRLCNLVTTSIVLVGKGEGGTSYCLGLNWFAGVSIGYATWLQRDDAQANVSAVADAPGLHDAVLISFARREQGIVTAPGNPLRVVRPIRDARFVDLIPAVFMCNSARRQERVCRARDRQPKSTLSRPQPAAETAPPAFQSAEMPANCELFVRDRQTSVRIGLRGGPERTRTSNQSIISGR